VRDDADGEDKHYECHDPSGEFNLTLFLEYYSSLSFFFSFWVSQRLMFNNLIMCVLVMTFARTEMDKI
jgi:hypothetical protein